MYQLQYILFSKKFTIYIFSNRKGFFLLLSEGSNIYIYIYNTIKQINMINSILGAYPFEGIRPLPKWPINV